MSGYHPKMDAKTNPTISKIRQAIRENVEVSTKVRTAEAEDEAVKQGRGGACSRRRPDICSRFNKHGLTNERDCGDREVCRRSSNAVSAVHPSVGRANDFDSASGSNPRKGCNVDPSVESERQAKRNGRRMGRLGMRRMEVNRDGLNWLGEEQGKTGCVD